MTDHDDDQDDRLGQAIRAYQVPPPAQGLAERVTRQVLAAGAAPAVRAGRPWRRGLTALALMAAGAAAALGLTWRPLDRPGLVAGERAAPARETVSLGGQAVAVLEAGAALRWGPGPDRVLTVEQLSGEVFYRVEAGPFVVLTPGGTVNVRGTCFRVEVPDMKLTAEKLKGATVGAALATAVMVTVYEGRVTFANRAGEVAVAAGESAGATPGQPPAVNATARRPGEEATRLALAAAGLRRVPQLSAEATPGERPSPSGGDELERLAAPLRAVIQQVAQGRDIEHLKVRPHGRPGKRVYNLDFDVDGINHELDVDPEGKVLTSEVDLPLTALPEVITRSVQSSYPAASLVDAELNQNEGVPRYYEIHIRRDGRIVELQVLEDGRIARELLDCPHGDR